MPAGVMTRFRLTELSGVDRPAQAGALVTFIKRDDRTVGDLKNEAAANARGKGWELVKAGALDVLDKMAKARAEATAIPYARAYDEVVTANPDLYAQAR